VSVLVVKVKDVAVEGFALEEAVAEFGQPILRYCHALLCDYHEAQDAVQIVFLKAYEKQDAFDGKNLSAWLYRIAYTTCMDILRQQKKQKSMENGLQEQQKQQKDSGMSPRLEEALQKLKPTERALVYSRAVDEISYEELAKIYDTSAPTLRKRYERAKNKLAKLLTQRSEKDGQQ